MAVGRYDPAPKFIPFAKAASQQTTPLLTSATSASWLRWGADAMEVVNRVQQRPGMLRVAAAFLILFTVYQTSEGLQTVFAPNSPVGPALMILALLLAWPLGRWLGWHGYDAYGLDLRRQSFALLGAGMLFSALAFLASRSLGSAMGLYSPNDGIAAGSIGFLTFAVVSTFIPSITEDILTRGFLLRSVAARLTALPYVVGSALLYTVNHMWRFDWGMSEQVRLFCLGLAYGAAAWRWQNLWAAVALHWGWNLTNVLASEMMPSDTLSIDAARYLTAAANLAILAIVLLLPRHSDQQNSQ